MRYNGEKAWGTAGVKGMGYGCQHGGMVSGGQMLTDQAYGHHSKSYIHNVYRWEGLNKRWDDCGTYRKVRIMGKRLKR